jgi:WD40 repeat protein
MEGRDDPLPPGAVGRLGTLRFRHDGDVNTFALSADGKTLATASGQVVVLWDSATGKELRRLEGHTGTVRSLAFTADGRTLASEADDNCIRLWNTRTAKAVRRIEVPLAPRTTGVYRLVFTPDG